MCVCFRGLKDSSRRVETPGARTPARLSTIILEISDYSHKHKGDIRLFVLLPQLPKTRTNHCSALRGKKELRKCCCYYLFCKALTEVLAFFFFFFSQI